MQTTATNPSSAARSSTRTGEGGASAILMITLVSSEPFDFVPEGVAVGVRGVRARYRRRGAVPRRTMRAVRETRVGTAWRVRERSKRSDEMRSRLR